MPDVTLEELSASYERFFKGKEQAFTLVKQICDYAQPKNATKLSEKRDILRLMQRYKKHPTFPALTTLLQKTLKFPKTYNWKNALYNNAPYPQHCIDTSRTPDPSMQFETSQMWLPSAASVRLRSFSCLQSKNSIQQVAMIVIGNITTLCIATSQTPEVSSQMARRTGKHLARLFSQAKTAEELLAAIPALITDTTEFIHEQNTTIHNVYGMIMRIFRDEANPLKKKVVYAGIGNCDLMLLQLKDEHTLTQLITAKEQFEHPIGFSSEGFLRDPVDVTSKLIIVDPSDAFLMTTPPALTLYDRSPLIERRVGFANGEAKLPGREMRLSQEDLRILMDAAVLAYLHNYDLVNLARALADPILPVSQNLLKLVQSSYYDRQLLIRTMQENLKFALTSYNNSPYRSKDNGDNLIGFLNWLDTVCQEQAVTKAQVNSLLYFMGFECTSSNHVTLADLEKICTLATTLPRLPPYCFVVRYPEMIEIEQAAFLEMLYYEIEAELEKQEQAPLRAKLQDSKGLALCKGIVAAKKMQNGLADKAPSFNIHELINKRLVLLETNSDLPVAEMAHGLLLLILEIIDIPEFQGESKKVLVELESKLFESYQARQLEHDPLFALALRLHALGYDTPLSNSRKHLLLPTVNLLPRIGKKIRRPSKLDRAHDQSKQSQLEQLLELWQIAQSSNFRECVELQEYLQTLVEQKYAFAVYLQALLLLNQQDNLPSIEIFSQILMLLKQAILESVTHAIVALGMLMNQPMFDSLFDAIPIQEDRPSTVDLRHFMAWAEFLKDQSHVLLLPEAYQFRAKQTVVRGVERLTSMLEESTLLPALEKVHASIPGYLAWYLLQKGLPMVGLNYAIIAIAQNDPLGLYVFARICSEVRQIQDPRFEAAFKAMQDMNEQHHRFVALLFTHIKSSRNDIHLALRPFAKNHQQHPIANYLNAQPCVSNADNVSVPDLEGMVDLVKLRGFFKPTLISKPVLAIEKQLALDAQQTVLQHNGH